MEKMHYKKYKPSPLLRDYIVSYYLWESKGSLPKPFSITSHANGCLAMVFNFGDSYCLYNGLYEGRVLPQQFLSGASTTAYTLKLEGKIGMAGIIFKGSAFLNLFSLPSPQELLDDRVDLTAIIGSKAERISDQLAMAKTSKSRVHILDQFLLNQLKKANKSLTIADQAAGIILQHRGMVRMDNLAAQLCISPRQLRRTFKDRIGLSPKYFARSKRFSFVNLCLTNNQQFSWRRFVNENAYYDQSHFIKDYQEFFGKKPSLQIMENRQVALKLGTA